MNDKEIPKEGFKDYAHAVVRSGLGAIPFAGTGAIEIFNMLITPPIQKRRDEWMQSIGERISTLESEGKINIEHLIFDESFSTILLHASQVAVRNHQDEKLQALHNAIVNACMPSHPDESKQLMFLTFVDTFTIWHIRLLQLFQNPRAWFESNDKTPPTFTMTSSIRAVLDHAYPEMINEQEFAELIINELKTKGLWAGGELNLMMSPTGAFESRTTSFGNEFISYISSR